MVTATCEDKYACIGHTMQTWTKILYGTPCVQFYLFMYLLKLNLF
jgi:hypothetical protein